MGKGKTTVLIVYVDDIVLTVNHEEEMSHAISALEGIQNERPRTI